MGVKVSSDQKKARLAALRSSYTVAEAAKKVNVTESGMSMWLSREKIDGQSLLLPKPNRTPPGKYDTERGAKILAKRIERYWRDEGHSVRCQVVNDGITDNYPHFGVRSDMINGLPAKLARRGV
jgi:transposase